MPTPARTAADLSAEVGRIEAALTRLLRGGHIQRLHDQLAGGEPRIDRAAYRVLGHIADAGPLRLSELAGHLGVDVSTVSRQVSDLERRALVARRADPLDRRAALLTLTDEGRATLDELRRLRRQVLADLLAGWPPGDRDQLSRLLQRLVDDIAAFTGHVGLPPPCQEDP